MTFRLFLIALMMNALVVGSASATLIKWHLQDVAFDDGGTASGSFIYDADTSTFSSINVMTSTGSILPGENYDIVLPISPGSSVFLSFANSLGIFDFTGTYAIAIALPSAMTNLGGTITFDVTSFWVLESLCVDKDCLGVVQPLRRLTSGYITTNVSEPSFIGLFTALLLGLGFTSREPKLTLDDGLV